MEIRVNNEHVLNSFKKVTKKLVRSYTGAISSDRFSYAGTTTKEITPGWYVETCQCHPDRMNFYQIKKGDGCVNNAFRITEE